MSTIRCLYTCNQCGLDDVGVDVPEREPGMHIVVWMERLCVATIAADHRARSPMCTAEKLTHLKIPIPKGTQNVGEKPRS